MRLDWIGTIAPVSYRRDGFSLIQAFYRVSLFTYRVDYPHIGPSSIGLVSKAVALDQSQRGSAGNRADLSDIVYQGLASNLLLRV